MNADPVRIEPAIANRTESRADLFGARQHLLGLGLCLRRQTPAIPVRWWRAPAHLAHKAVIQTLPVMIRKRFGTNSGSVPDASTTCISAVRWPISRAASAYSPIRSCTGSGTSGGNGKSAIAGNRPECVKCEFEEAAQRVQRVVPGAAMIRNETMQNANAHRLAGVGTVFHRPGNRRRVLESMIGQKGTDLHFRVRPRLNATEQFQNESVSVGDGCVPLIGAQHRRLQQRSILTPDAAERPRMRSDQFPARPRIRLRRR